MQLCKAMDDGTVRLGLVRSGHVIPLDLRRDRSVQGLNDILAAADPVRTALQLADTDQTTFPLSSAALIAPIDRQEVWAAGVTYKRSKVAREAESVGAAAFYDKVYTADRPELFF